MWLSFTTIRHPEGRKRAQVFFIVRAGPRDLLFLSSQTQGPSPLLGRWRKRALVDGVRDDDCF
jgi:hypothetical protein